MDRRQLLARAGAVLGGLSLGGCLGQYRDFAGEREDATAEDTAEETTRETTTRRPTLVKRTLTVTDSGCGEPTNEAAVEFDARNAAVAVTGTIGGSNACYTAVLRDATYDPETGTLDVTVTSEEEGDGVCAQCLVRIDYEAAFDFEGGLPETVTVVHEAMGESTTVTTARSG